MTELNGLLASHALAGGPRRAIECTREEKEQAYQADSPENDDARQDILTAMKDLHYLQVKLASAQHKIRRIVFFEIKL
ncbi:hypothetical protein OAL29_01480 [Candidatus Binatia bacterium]|nr:hypothetical protein [Candidatus Binatia bacterium]